MPHSPEGKKRVITRLRKVQGQARALEAVVAEGANCGDVLQQLAAMRGGVNGLMAEVLEGHLRETFGHTDCYEPTNGDALSPEHEQIHQAIDEAVRLVRSYLK